MAYTDIDDPSAYFHTQLYTGNATARSITNDANAGNFQPDWLWIKVRNNANNHRMFDSSRGANLDLVTNLTQGDSDSTDRCTGFDSNGFSLGNNAEVNSNTHNIVSWQWKANGGTTASNTDGDITSTVQANTEAGFSIVTYTGNGNASAQTVGHGLGAECRLVLLKSRSLGDEGWRVFHESVSQSAGGNLFLNGTSGLDTGDPARITSTNTTTFTLDGYHSTYDAINEGSATYLAYCFAEKQGYSKIGKYIGNGSTNGTFVYTGFKPAWVLVKTVDVAQSWQLSDSTRSPFNVINDRLSPNSEAGTAESISWIDFTSNGFKLRHGDVAWNGSGGTYIYMAFAESPFVSSTGTPTTAR